MKLNQTHWVRLIVLTTCLFANQAQANSAESYGETVSRKMLSGMANLTTSGAEIPKNIVRITNQSNIIWGLAGGTITGLLNTVGRIGVGLTDLLTAPIPTQASVYPLYVWDDWNQDTQYGPILVIQR